MLYFLDIFSPPWVSQVQPAPASSLLYILNTFSGRRGLGMWFSFAMRFGRDGASSLQRIGSWYGLSVVKAMRCDCSSGSTDCGGWTLGDLWTVRNWLASIDAGAARSSLRKSKKRDWSRFGSRMTEKELRMMVALALRRHATSRNKVGGSFSHSGRLVFVAEYASLRCCVLAFINGEGAAAG